MAKLLKIRNLPERLFDLGQGMKQNAGGRLIEAHESPTGEPINPGESFIATEEWYKQRAHWRGLKVLEDESARLASEAELRQRVVDAEVRAEHAVLGQQRTRQNLLSKLAVIRAKSERTEADDARAELLLELLSPLSEAEQAALPEPEAKRPADPPTDPSPSDEDADGDDLTDVLHAGVKLLEYRQLQRLAKAMEVSAGGAEEELLARVLAQDSKALGAAVSNTLSEDELATIRAKLEAAAEE